MRRVTLRRGKATGLDLREALDSLGIGRGEDFSIVPASEFAGQLGEVGPYPKDKPTSRDAAYANAPRRGTQRERVLVQIVSCGVTGATRDEVADLLHMPPNVATPRVLELIQGGHVEETSRTRATRAGEQATVLVATPKGRDAV